jgi:2-dehydropantoate 2-reductase
LTSPVRKLEVVALCGAGAVGSAYAEKLHDLDPSAFTVIAGAARRALLEREGLTVNGRSFPVWCRAPGEAGPPADLLLVAVKRHQLAAALEDVRAAVGTGTIVLPLLNGIGAEAILAAAFGGERVLHGFVVGNDVVRDGTRTRYTRIGRLFLGAASNDRGDARVLAVQALLDRAGIPNVVPEDIHREQWWKFVLNVGVNQVSAVLRAPYGAFAAVPEVRELTRLASLEAAALAAREGVALSPDCVERIFPILSTLAPDGKTSMLQDVEAGRKTEVEAFAGTVVELGRRHGVPTPVNALLLRMIVALERMAIAGR